MVAQLDMLKWLFFFFCVCVCCKPVLHRGKWRLRRSLQEGCACCCIDPSRLVWLLLLLGMLWVGCPSPCAIFSSSQWGAPQWFCCTSFAQIDTAVAGVVEVTGVRLVDKLSGKGKVTDAIRLELWYHSKATDAEIKTLRKSVEKILITRSARSSLHVVSILRRGALFMLRAYNVLLYLRVSSPDRDLRGRLWKHRFYQSHCVGPSGLGTSHP